MHPRVLNAAHLPVMSFKSEEMINYLYWILTQKASEESSKITCRLPLGLLLIKRLADSCSLVGYGEWCPQAGKMGSLPPQKIPWLLELRSTPSVLARAAESEFFRPDEFWTLGTPDAHCGKSEISKRRSKRRLGSNVWKLIAWMKFMGSDWNFKLGRCREGGIHVRMVFYERHPPKQDDQIASASSGRIEPQQIQQAPLGLPKKIPFWVFL